MSFILCIRDLWNELVGVVSGLGILRGVYYDGGASIGHRPHGSGSHYEEQFTAPQERVLGSVRHCDNRREKDSRPCSWHNKYPRRDSNTRHSA